MIKNYLKHTATRTTPAGLIVPQSVPLPGAGQVQNSAGGYAWQVSDEDRLERFLILGSEGGTYYASEQKLTRENAAVVERCIQVNGIRTVDKIVEISHAGRAPKNDPAIFALAIAAKLGDTPTRRYALQRMPDVCRTGTHLFQFVEACKAFGGWGRSMRKGIGAWYNDKDVDDLAYQVLKYQNRNGWSHADLLRMAHPCPATDAHDAIYRKVVGKEVELDKLPVMFEAAANLHANVDVVAACNLIRAHNLPREVVPTQLLNVPEVWDALLERMPMTALLRNLATMTRVGLIAPMSDGLNRVVAKLGNGSMLRMARVHPITVLSALMTYKQGHGVKSKHTWNPVGQVVDALDEAFYAAFGLLEPSGARTLLALDVSGSMQGGEVAGVPGLTPAIATACMAMATARVEKKHGFVAFGGHLTTLDISPKQRLDDVVRRMRSINFGRTDCSLPMLAARQEGWLVDTFVVYTDNETWSGKMHPAKALEAYRQHTGIPAKLAVVGMTATDISIADPRDAGMMDVVGFDTAAPQVIADFSRPRAIPVDEPAQKA